MQRTFFSLAVLGLLLAALLGGCGGAPAAPSKIACLYMTDDTEAVSFSALLNGNGYVATAVAVSGTTTPADLMGYDLFVITDESTSYGSWTTYASTIDNACSKPVVGVGQCGHYYFLGILNSATVLPGLSGGGSSSPVYTKVEVTDPDNSIWAHPKPITIPEDGLVQIYLSDQKEHATTVPGWPETGSNNGISIGIEQGSSDPVRHTLAREGGRYFHWGYYGGPDVMTQAGKDLFVNAVHYMLTTD